MTVSWRSSSPPPSDGSVPGTDALKVFALDVAALLGLGSSHLLRRVDLGVRSILQHDPDTGHVAEVRLVGARMFQSGRPSPSVEVWMPEAAPERLRYWLPSQDSSAFVHVHLVVGGETERRLWRFAAERCAFVLRHGPVDGS